MTVSSVSRQNTPQAHDDFAATFEDSAILIDVMSNDLGGAAKTLYSVNQGNLLLANTTGLSNLGAKISIVNGSISYDGTQAAAVQALKAGEIATDTFTYSIRLGNGTISTATVSVTVTGQNDAAVIDAVHTVATGGVTEDSASNHVASGQVIVTDADRGESAFQAPSSLTGQYGAFGFDSATGKWTYTVDDTKVQFLGEGKTTTDTLSVTSVDGTAHQDIVVTITGTNDAAVISGPTTGSVAEYGTLTTGGKLLVSDKDAGQDHFQVPTGSALHGSYGDFTFADGVWAYQLRSGDASVKALTSHDEVHDELSVTSLDGSDSKVIDVTVYGHDDGTSVSLGTENYASIQDVQYAPGSHFDYSAIYDYRPGEVFSQHISYADSRDLYSELSAAKAVYWVNYDAIDYSGRAVAHTDFWIVSTVESEIIAEFDRPTSSSHVAEAHMQMDVWYSEGETYDSITRTYYQPQDGHFEFYAFGDDGTIGTNDFGAGVLVGKVDLPFNWSGPIDVALDAAALTELLGSTSADHLAIGVRSVGVKTLSAPTSDTLTGVDDTSQSYAQFSPGDVWNYDHQPNLHLNLLLI